MMNNKQNFAVVIPARYQSSRFPGKPLVDLCGKTMIQHVWEKSSQAVGANNVYVATDDKKIELIVKGFGGNVIRTSSNCLTGTDRLAEANKVLNFDFIVNVQGDEPLISPDDINTVVEAYINGDGSVVNAMCKISSEEEFHSLTVPKVVASPSGSLMYMSRSGIPLSKKGEFKFGFKQVCIYAFSSKHLDFIYANNKKTPLEEVEDIEILRLLESGFSVKMVEVKSGSIAIDVPGDVAKVIHILENV